MKITMKKAIGLIIAVMMAATLAACGNEVEKAGSSVGDPETKSMFVQVEDAGIWVVVYHRDTKVMYSVSRGGYNSGNMTLLVNADGTPMIYSGNK
jgi:predicted small secreted protein